MTVAMSMMRLTRMIVLCAVLSLLLCSTGSAWSLSNRAVVASTRHLLTKRSSRSFALAVARDEKGYEIKPRDWFNGLSLDPGASLTDPRAVPPECKKFAEDIKANKIQPSLKEVIEFIDKHYEYFAVRVIID